MATASLVHATQAVIERKLREKDPTRPGPPSQVPEKRSTSNRLIVSMQQQDFCLEPLPRFRCKTETKSRSCLCFGPSIDHSIERLEYRNFVFLHADIMSRFVYG